MLLVSLFAQAAVAASPATAASSQGVLSYPAAYFAGQQVANADEMLARVPGFSLDTGASVRGFEGAAGNVLIDGRRPSSKSDDLHEILRRIPVSSVERIDIIRGGAPGIDMQGKSVLANIVRKKGDSFHGLYEAREKRLWDGRDMHGMRLELGGGDGARTWETTARYGYGNDDGGDDGPQLRYGPDGTVVKRSNVHSESDGLQKTVTGAYAQPLLGGRVSVNGRLFWNKWKYEETNTYTDPASLGAWTEVDPSRAFHTEAGGRFDRDFGSRTKLELIVLRTDKQNRSDNYFTYQGDVSEFHNDRTGAETIGRGVLKHQLFSTLSIELGGEGAFNQLDSKSRYLENGALIPLPAADVRVEEPRGEAFIKGAWRPSERWTVDAGLRYERSRISSSGDVLLEKSLGYLKPRIAVSFAPEPNTQFRLRVEKEVGQLDFDDFVASSDFSLGHGVSAGNPNLDPEQAWVAEAELEKRFWDGAAVVLSYRHYKVTDAVDRGPVRLVTTDPVTGAESVSFFDQPTNIGDGTRKDLSASLNLPFDHFGWKGALLKAEIHKRWTEVTDPTTHTARPVSNLRPLLWEAHFSQDLPRGASVGWDVFGGWSQTSYRYNYISEIKLHNAYLVGWFEKKLQPDLTLRMEVHNITERGIRFTTAVYDGPRGEAPLVYTDDRDLNGGRAVYVRLRKTFGR